MPLPSPEKVIAKLQRQVSELKKYQQWIHMHARHSVMCAKRRDRKADCTCGLAGLDSTFK